MICISMNAELVINGVTYSGNNVYQIKEDFFQLCLHPEVAYMFTFSKLQYRAQSRALGSPDIIEYDLTAQDSNGHVTECLLKFENERNRITVKKS
jgi:hypothetical protein